MQHHIAAGLTGDAVGGVLDGGVHQRREMTGLLRRFLRAGLRVRDVVQQIGLAAAQGDGHIFLRQGVVNRGDDLGLGGDAQGGMPDGHSVAEGHPLQHSGIFRLLPQRLEGNRQGGDFHTQGIVLQIGLRLGAESILCDGFFLSKAVGEIPDEGLALTQSGVRNGKQHLGEGDHRFTSVIGGNHRVRQQVGVDLGDVAVVLQFGEVFAVLDHHAGVLPTALVVDDIEIVPLIFAAPQIQKGTGHAAQTGADTLGLCHGEGLFFRVVRLTGEVVGGGSILEDTLHGQRGRNTLAGPGQRGNAGEIIGDVLGIHRYHAIDRRGDAVDAEGLVIGGIVGLGLDDPLGGHLPVVSPCDGILEHQLVGAVSLFGHLTGDTVSQHADAVGGEIHRIRFEQNRNHSVTHLGCTTRLVTVPTQEMVLTPGCSLGNPSPLTLSFMGAVPE